MEATSMAGTLTEYMAEQNWDELDDDAKINVLTTYIIDLESRMGRAERDIDIIDGDI